MRMDTGRCDPEQLKLPDGVSVKHVEDGLLSYQIVITYRSTVLIVTNLTAPLEIHLVPQTATGQPSRMNRLHHYPKNTTEPDKTN